MSPRLAQLAGSLQRAELTDVEVFVEQAAFEQSRRCVQRCGNQRGIHVIRVATLVRVPVRCRASCRSCGRA